MKKLNWGHGIIIFFICYVGYLAGAIITSLSIDHSLVVEDYYAHDIAYQKLYFDASENRNSLKMDLAVIVDDVREEVLFNFGKRLNGINGELLFYRPSDKDLDVRSEFMLSPEQSNYSFSIKAFKKGKWIIKIRWDDGIRDYYKEEVLII